jgi:hypothetical protein
LSAPLIFIFADDEGRSNDFEILTTYLFELREIKILIYRPFITLFISQDSDSANNHKSDPPFNTLTAISMSSRWRVSYLMPFYVC